MNGCIACIIFNYRTVKFFSQSSFQIPRNMIFSVSRLCPEQTAGHEAEAGILFVSTQHRHQPHRILLL